MMGSYQYQARADALRSQGVEVHEFGARHLREGCFGEDVLALQNWLAEEAYYNPVDGGYTGYFGSVTKEALQAWQRDQGVDTSGAFDSASKRAYLQQAEARAAQVASGAFLETAQSQVQVQAQAQSAVVAGPAPVAPSMAVATAQPQLTRAAAPASDGSAALLGASILLGAGVVAAFRSLRRRFRAASARRAAAAAAADGGEQWEPEEYASAAGQESPDTAAAPTGQGKSRLRRLSDDEVQRYLAPMKGEASSRSPVQVRPPAGPIQPHFQDLRVAPQALAGPAPAWCCKQGVLRGPALHASAPSALQRPAPRPLHLEDRAAAAAAPASKYGT